MQNKTAYVTVFLFVLVLTMAAAFRLADLSRRPLHGDEANQAVKTGMLYDKGLYQYDPHEHHGPTLYYLELPLLWLSGARDFADSDIIPYRMLPVLAGLLIIVLLWPLRDALGGTAFLWAALFIALSHCMTYYSRYYIQEMLLVCFMQAALVCGWRYLKRPTWGWAVLFGVSAGLLHATKETSILLAFSAVAALAGAVFFARIFGVIRLPDLIGILPWKRTARHALIAVGVAVLVSVTFFSSFFTHLRGPLDSLLTYANYLHRADGAGSAGIHDKPWNYYLLLLSYVYRQAGPRWSEGAVLLLALAGGLSVLARLPFYSTARREAGPAFWFRCFLLLYGVLLLALFSAIPYKTPWNVLAPYHALLLLAGVGASEITRPRFGRMAQAMACLVLLAGAAHLGWQNYQGNFVYDADARNPYVYAHPSRAIHRLVERIDAIAAVSGEGTAMHINLIQPQGDYWPLPWYLRKYTRVGWWTTMPEQPDAAIVLSAPALHDEVRQKLKGEYIEEFHAMRPGILLNAWIRRDLWDAFMKTRQ